jgi:hypothetical protein
MGRLHPHHAEVLCQPGHYLMTRLPSLAPVVWNQSDYANLREQRLRGALDRARWRFELR